MSAGQSFKFLGSSFKVQTGFLIDSPPQALTGITQANPGVISATAHGYLLGAVVRPTAVVGMTEVNSKLYVVDNPDTNDFEMANYDTTNNRPYTSGGVLAEVDFAEFCELTSVDQQDGTADQQEITTICSTVKEFIDGIANAGTLTLNFNLARNGLVQAALIAAKKAGTELAYKLTLPGTGGTMIMIGKVLTNSFSGSVGSPVWTGSTAINLTQEVFDLPAA